MAHLWIKIKTIGRGPYLLIACPCLLIACPWWSLPQTKPTHCRKIGVLLVGVMLFWFYLFGGFQVSRLSQCFALLRGEWSVVSVIVDFLGFSDLHVLNVIQTDSQHVIQTEFINLDLSTSFLFNSIFAKNNNGKMNFIFVPTLLFTKDPKENVFNSCCLQTLTVTVTVANSQSAQVHTIS